jgi:hypothetical protein
METRMAEHVETIEFWKGVAVGTLVGLVAAAYARGDFSRFLSFASIPEPQTFPSGDAFREHPGELKLRREASENAGDPTRLSPAVASTSTQQAISIERPTGAPGPKTAPEILEVPGHPGQVIDHSDAGQSVQSAARTYNPSSEN